MTAETPEVTPNQDEDHYEAPKWLLSLVIVMGIIIVGMIAVIAFTVISRSTGGDEPVMVERTASKPAAVTPAAVSQSTVASKYMLMIEPPEGGTLVDIAGGGADAILRFSHADGSWTLVVFDSRKGVERGRVKVQDDREARARANLKRIGSD